MSTVLQYIIVALIVLLAVVGLIKALRRPCAATDECSNCRLASHCRRQKHKS